MALRLGTLGAAKIAPLALLRSARRVEGIEVATPPADAVANMRVVDAIYEAAGLPLRGAGTANSAQGRTSGPTGREGVAPRRMRRHREHESLRTVMRPATLLGPVGGASAEAQGQGHRHSVSTASPRSPLTSST